MIQGVAKTGILTLRARADEHRRPDSILSDARAAGWFDQVEWPAELDRWYYDGAQQSLAMRADDIDHIIGDAIGKRPAKVLVELGCGLSTRSHRLAHLGFEHWVDVDLPEAISLRQKFGAGTESAFSGSVLDFAWMNRVDAFAGNDLVFVAEGLLYYLDRNAVDDLFNEMSRRFSGALLVMDVLGANDFERLRQHTAALGTPIVWHHEGPLEDCLEAFGLSPFEDASPELLYSAMIRRYWHRFSPQLQGGIFFAKGQPAYWARRSGNVIGRL